MFCGVRCMDYNFSNNLRKTVDFSSQFGREYIKNDFKYLLIPFLTLFTLMFSMLYTILIIIENKYSNFNQIMSELITMLVIFIIFVLWSAYILTWLIHSKAYHIVQTYTNPGTTYRETLDNTVKFRFRVFIGSVIYSLITFGVIVFLYAILFLLLYLLGGPTPDFQFFVSISYLSVIGPTFVIMYFLVPLQIYPSVLLIENNLGYKDGIKRSFEILSSWKNKLKFIVLYLLLIYIANFIMEFVLIGAGLVSLFVIIVVVFGLHLTVTNAILFGIFVISLGVAIYTTIFIEVNGIITGNVYGQSYINLVHPELDSGPVKKSSYDQGYVSKPFFCTNCGSQLQPNTLYCPTCGQKIQ